MKDIENIQIPDPQFEPDQSLKKTLLNTRSSARIGIAFILVPAIFLFSMFLKYALGFDLGIINAIEKFFAELDQSPYTKWMSPIIFGLLPLAAFIIFFLSMTHFAYNKHNHLLQISFKVRLLNIILLLVSGLIFGTIMLYVILENWNHPIE